MLEIDGIPPKLGNRTCEELLCQQYWYHGKLAQEVDALFLKVNGRWHQLYFENGVVFWRPRQEAPQHAAAQPGDPFVYPLIDIGVQFDLKGRVITDYLTEALVGGARVSFLFEDRGTLLVVHADNQTSLRFIKAP